MMKFKDLRATIAHLHELRASFGREHVPFEIQAVCIDRFGLDGYRQLAEIGVTDVIAVPWIMEGHDFGAPVEAKVDSLKRFADNVIGAMDPAR